jgi:hypothetical protein
MTQEVLRDRNARGLVAMDAADDENGNACRIADLVCDDRAALRRAAEQLAVRRRGSDQRGSESSRAEPAAAVRGSSVT